MLFGVDAVDLVTWVPAAVALTLATAAACWVPARRAAAVDPGAALRADAR
jgi:ABC-type lipoprotein release transport system permease subunit